MNRKSTIRCGSVTKGLCCVETLEQRQLYASYAISDYFPMEGGNSWQLVGSSSLNFPALGTSQSLSGSLSRTSTQVTDLGVAATRFSDVTATGGIQSTAFLRVYSMNGSGLFLHSAGYGTATVDYEAPRLIIPAYISDGLVTSWSGIPTDVGMEQAGYHGVDSGSATVVGVETVFTPAGTYQALKVVLDHSNQGQGTISMNGTSYDFTANMHIVETVWLGEHLGIVKSAAAVGASFTAAGKSFALTINESATLVDSCLPAEWVIDGTSGDDDISVTQLGFDYELNVNGTRSQKPANSVRAITIRGFEGNDNIAIDDVIDTPCNINGGAGMDTIAGGAGRDFLAGGSGSDLIFGGGGADYVLAGSGSDTVYAGAGSDTVVGGAGTDYIVGQGGADSILGCGGNDTLDGGASGDTIVGGGGNDEIYGGGGNDWIYVDDGSVTPSQDTVYTGPGTNHVDYDWADTVKGEYVNILA